ncbi:SNF2-related protein [Pseudoflavonifractor sp. An85]|uniref:SNF2-related protein n=1 Tax=Pseudoflavonifractor sp. An85 TaxID=1965661 RepID=UPI000B3871FC|nr:SNF2-related protein [Pseudoflavonifractor sp. An85]OUN21943.1 helicase [Pseudoflavonifractor sp. An85]
MFRDLPLQATYSSYEDNLGEQFYSPVLAQSIRYDRATAYFSAKALANYAKGLECFAQNGHTMRLIVSAEIDKEDYLQIQDGYALRASIREELVARMRESLSLEEERNISNLAYLVGLGVIDIKVAFTQEGIFHDKFGIVEDAEGNIICFRGSNNETAAAFESNYEAFDITCSWQASPFDYSKITKSQQTFEKLWSNQTENICVLEMDSLVYQELEKHNKGQLIIDPLQLETDCMLLDCDGVLTLDFKGISNLLWNTSFYKIRLKRFVDTTKSTDERIFFKDILKYPQFNRIISLLQNESEKRGYRFFVTSRLRKYIADRELHIEKRAGLGLAIKQHSPDVLGKYEEYKAVVNDAFSRPLREKQMWDSFFMCTMKKACNFSVPGSGKTASVLGVFAYLYAKGFVRRLVMVGPKNSFGSWQEEFQLCFGNKWPLQVFNIHNPSYKTADEKRTALLFDSGSANLVLLNYECLRSYLPEVQKLVGASTLLVFDEVHKVKAIDGSNAQKALELAENACYTIALTGTPIPNSYTDIWNLLNILYHNEYDEFFGFTPQQLKDPSQDEINLINKKIQPFFCRTTKQQLEVPEANPDIIEEVSANDTENQLFHILQLKYAKNKLALIVRLLQLESNPRMLLNKLDLSDFADILDISAADIEDIDYVDYSEDVKQLIDSIQSTSKFRACISLAEKLITQRKPVIIWCIFVDSINRIATALRDMGIDVACIYGQTTMEERQQIVSAFRDGCVDVLITNPHTLAESVSLHKGCHDAIYFEYSYNLVHLLQSKDRIHRLGLPDGQYTQYYYLQQQFVTGEGEPFSLDARILNRLNEKERIMLEAIENNCLESVTTVQEDLDLIFQGLKL